MSLPMAMAMAMTPGAIFGMPTVIAIFFGLAFLLGLAFIPLLAMTVGRALPAMIAEGLANLLFALTMLGRDWILDQRETDEYVLRPAADETRPRSYWSRWAGATFGISFEATREAFYPHIVSEAREQELEALVFDEDGDDGTASVDLDRGGARTSWYVSRSDLDAETILVPIGQRLATLRDVAGPAMGMEAYAEALKDYGGDTSTMSNKMMVGSTAIFVVLGLGLGFVIFF